MNLMIYSFILSFNFNVKGLLYFYYFSKLLSKKNKAKSLFYNKIYVFLQGHVKCKKKFRKHIYVTWHKLISYI